MRWRRFMKLHFAARYFDTRTSIRRENEQTDEIDTGWVIQESKPLCSLPQMYMLDMKVNHGQSMFVKMMSRLSHIGGRPRIPLLLPIPIFQYFQSSMISVQIRPRARRKYVKHSIA
jgi:hypothetical protein